VAGFSNSELAACWRLIKPYWVSEEKWAARGLYVLVLLLDLATVAIATWLTYWNKNYFNAFVAYDLKLVWFRTSELALIAISTIVSTILRTWFYQSLQIRWRKWVTDVYLGNWLTGSVFHRLEMLNTIDNTDQRVSEDLRDMVDLSLHISLGLIRNIVQLASFSVIIWKISGTLSFTVFGLAVNIPGHMLWVSVIYALVASVMMEKYGRKMVSVEYEQKQRESDFRFLMMRIRENSAQIAISSGGKSERVKLAQYFKGIELNWQSIKQFTRRISFVENFYTEFGVILAYLLIIPRYFARQVELGSIMQLTMSFTRVRVGFAWFIFQYKRLADLRAMFRRIGELENLLLDKKRYGDIVINESQDTALRIDNLNLTLPDGKPLTCIGSLCIEHGSRWIIKGDSGVGKTTFLRAISGLWKHGSGVVNLPKGKMMFLPQESYLPLGSLKTSLCYPELPENFSDETCVEALSKCGLAPYSGFLEDENIQWSKKLSPGEKQRLAFARALLLQPDFLFMDEATSALDLKMEQNLFVMLLANLPQTTIISVAHRPSLEQYHNQKLEIKAA